MGSTGPIPKRSDERIRRNATDIPVEKVTAIGTVEVPELDLPVDELHPLVQDYYQAMIDSGQARYFEPTDWQHARLAMLAMNEMLTARYKTGKQAGERAPISVMKLQVLNQMLSTLLVTEGDRRRVRMEIERQNGNPDGAQVVQMSDYFKQQFGA
ncbi:hypothetical protein A5630_23150 [Mycolicibacterium mucogenicum]|uniref:Terminase small subunit n=1 Tax=Mycolicibacterium mucogenicum TaxID=56689 RepID=A0A1A3GZ69_MYCMU|nr:hypothetical protein [Mycolicibacterium mucogenicum]OBJ41337.1 hypothetical protein A5630_23150 [Mycolicibacterium mucogenicum]